MENNQQEQQPNKIKTYTQRFQEMETQLESLVQLYNEANQAFSVTASIITDISTQVRMLNDQIQAIYDLSESGKKLTRENITKQINIRRVEKIENLLKKDEAAGIIKKIDVIETENDIVVYESEDISIAFKAVAGFESEGLTVQDFVGKKAGDAVGSIKIKQVYQIVQQPSEGQSDEQKQ